MQCVSSLDFVRVDDPEKIEMDLEIVLGAVRVLEWGCIGSPGVGISCAKFF